MIEIKDYVEISFEINYIQVENDPIILSFSVDEMVNPPEKVEKLKTIVWDKLNPEQTCLIFSEAIDNGGSNLIFFGEEKYNDWVKPFVDLWQAEKDRQEQEQIEAEQEYAKFENRKERALDKIVEDYHGALANGFVRTSMGFDADISPDSVATLSATNLALNRNLLAEEAPKTVFRDFYGLERTLDKVQVELLICQINAAQNHIRELKYAFKTKVKETYDNDSLNTVLDACVYSTLDFSKPTGEGKPSVMPFEQPSTYVERIDTF